MKLRIKAVVENVDMLTDFVNEQLEGMECSHKTMTQITIALDELFSNICHYAYKTGIGQVLVDVNEVPEQNAVRITLADTGIPFDPLEREDPDVTLSLHDRSIGGLGIFMVKRFVDDIKYEYRDGMNILTVLKKL